MEVFVVIIAAVIIASWIGTKQSNAKLEREAEARKRQQDQQRQAQAARLREARAAARAAYPDHWDMNRLEEKRFWLEWNRDSYCELLEVGRDRYLRGRL
jgi:type II secretory pathway pseudopilin PulG